MSSPAEPDPVQAALEAARNGDRQPIGAVLEGFRARLSGMIVLRMDPSLKGRLDPEDVLQEAFGDVTRRLDEFLADPERDFYLWVRFLTGQKLLELHRRHVGAARRDARREVRNSAGVPWASSFALASAYFDREHTPSQVAADNEAADRLRQALDDMKETDREVLVLRHFEHLTNKETALVLALSEAAASLRYMRALQRLKAVLDEGEA